MRSSSSCLTTPARLRPSTCSSPRKRGPLPSSPTAYAVPPPSVKTPPLKPDMPVEGTKPWSLLRQTASCLSKPGTRTMSQRPPGRTLSDLPLCNTEPSFKLTSETSTESRRTRCTASSLGTWPPPSSSTSLSCPGTSGSRVESPRSLLPPDNPSARKESDRM